MKKIYSIIYPIMALMLAFGTNAVAQQGNISGRVLDSGTKNPVPFAYVFLFDHDSEKEVAKTFSDENGRFFLERVPFGKFDLKLTEVGHEHLFVQGIELNEDKQRLELGNISMQNPGRQLSEVMVSASIGITEISPQKTVFSAKDLPVAQGGTAGDILKLMPSVGMGGPPGIPRDVRYRGLEKSYTLVLINGRNSGIQGNSRETLINQIPATAVERIEIISNPGPQYDADGISGIVNIILKKDAQFGTHGNIGAFYDNRGGYNLSASLSHKVGNVDLYTHFDRNQFFFRDNSLMVETEEQIQYRDGEINGFRKVDATEYRDLLSQNFKTGAKFYPTKRSVIGAEYLYGSQWENRIKNTDTRNLRADESFNNRTLRVEDRIEDLAFHQFGLDYLLNFKNSGYLEVFGNYVYSPQIKERDQIDQRVSESGEHLNNQPSIQRNNESFNDNNFFFQAMVFKPISKNLNFRSGYKLFNRSRNSAQLIERFDYVENIFLPESDGRNNFDYHETIHSIFVNNEFNLNKLRAEIGYRHEYVNYASLATLTDDEVVSSYHMPLPTINAFYNIDTTQFVKFSFGRRIRRPNMNQLNPFEDNSDPSKIKAGNPDLLPEFAWAYEIGYMKNFKLFNIGTNLFRRDLTNVIQKVITDVEPGVIMERDENIGEAYIQGIEILAAIQPLKWLNINTNYSRFASAMKGEDQDGALQDQFAWSFKFIGDLVFDKPGIFIQAAYNAVGPKIAFDRTENTIAFWDFAASKSLFKGRSSLNVRLVDAFATNRKIRTETTAAQVRNRVQEAPGRLVSVGLNYSF